MKNKILFLLLFFTIKSYASFLHLNETNAFTLGTAEANSILLQSPSSILTNSAAIVKDSSYTAYFGFGKRLGELRYSEVAFSYPYNKFSFGILLGNAVIENLERRDYPTIAPMGLFSAREYRFGIATSYRLREKLFVGINAKHLINRIYDDEVKSTSYGLGLWGIYRFDWVYGLSIQGIGENLNRSQKRNEMISFALQKQNSLKMGVNVTPITKMSYFQEKFYASLGLNVQMLHILSLRSGYFFGYDSKSVSYGVGVQWKEYSIDWSMTPYQNDLGTASALSITISFPK